MKRRLLIMTLFVMVFLVILLLFPLQAFANGSPPGDPGESFVVLNVEGLSSESDTTFTLSLSNLTSGMWYGGEFQISNYDGTFEELLNENHQGHFITYFEIIYPINGNIGNWQKEINMQLSGGHYIAFLRISNGVDEAWDYKAFEIISPPKADALIKSGIPGKGLDTAPGQQKPFNPKSQAAEHAGKKK